MEQEIRFAAATGDNFYSALRKRVSEYFKTTGKSQNGNFAMWSKTFILLAGFGTAYGFILAPITAMWVKWILAGVVGFMIAGIGMSIQHDANHGSYSKNKTLNKVLGYTLNLLGGSRFTWIITHNQQHHTYTNIYGHDHDLDSGLVLRLSPYCEYRKFHRFQHLYAWFLYFFATLQWTVFKNYKHIYQHKEKIASKKLFRSELFIIILTSIINFGFMMVIPYLVLDVPFWYILIGYFTAHAVSGLILSVVFQLAHVVKETKHYSTDEDYGYDMENIWAIHQMETTADFARKNPFINWYVGGLNFQVEHHLFPNICHVHYRQISKIVEQTAKDYNVSYYDNSSFFKAVRSHYSLLKELGKTPATVKKPKKEVEMAAA